MYLRTLLLHNVSSYLLHLIYIVLICKHNFRFMNSNTFDQQFTLHHIVRIICTFVFIYIYRATFIVQIRYNLVQRFFEQGCIHRIYNVSKNWRYSNCYIFWARFKTRSFHFHTLPTDFSQENVKNSLETLKNFFSTADSKIEASPLQRSLGNLSKNFSSPSYWTLDPENDENSTKVLEFFSIFVVRFLLLLKVRWLDGKRSANFSGSLRRGDLGG